MKRPIWIPPLISITIVLYFTAAIMFVFLYYIRDTLFITIAFVSMFGGSLSMAAHIYFKYGGKSYDRNNQEIHGAEEGTREARKVD
jgi:hypothetical protein